VTAETGSGRATIRPYGSRAPRHVLVAASGWAALVTAAIGIWMAYEAGVFGDGWRPWYPWLPWLAAVLPPAAAGVLCLARPRQAAITGPAAVFSSCAVAAAYASGLPAGRNGVALAAALLLLLVAGASVVISAVVTAVMISLSSTISRRRAAVWATAGLLFAAIQIPSPLVLHGQPIQTAFAGNSSGGDAVTVCALVLLAAPLVTAGLASARLATVIAVAWLPGAAAQMLGWYVFRIYGLHADQWFYVSWVVWSAVAILALAEAGRWRADTRSSPPS
jgi:hypothetical protein